MQRAEKASGLWNRMLLSSPECVQSIKRLWAIIIIKTPELKCGLWLRQFSHQTKLWRRAASRLKHKWQFKARLWQHFKKGSWDKAIEKWQRWRPHSFPVTDREEGGGGATCAWQSQCEKRTGLIDDGSTRGNKKNPQCVAVFQPVDDYQRKYTRYCQCNHEADFTGNIVDVQFHNVEARFGNLALSWTSLSI